MQCMAVALGNFPFEGSQAELCNQVGVDSPTGFR